MVRKFLLEPIEILVEYLTFGHFNFKIIFANFFALFLWAFIVCELYCFTFLNQVYFDQFYIFITFMINTKKGGKTRYFLLVFIIANFISIFSFSDNQSYLRKMKSLNKERSSVKCAQTETWQVHQKLSLEFQLKLKMKTFSVFYVFT